MLNWGFTIAVASSYTKWEVQVWFKLHQVQLLTLLHLQHLQLLMLITVLTI